LTAQRHESKPSIDPGTVRPSAGLPATDAALIEGFSNALTASRAPPAHSSRRPGRRPLRRRNRSFPSQPHACALVGCTVALPAGMSTLVLKLLAKTPEERYQSAAGVEADLRHCLAEWKACGRIADFSPGHYDSQDRLLIPEKLYGRAREVETLLTAFDRVVNGGKPELVLVSGYSGIGKSAVVNELHKPLVPPRGLFASGKFDQYKRDIPYATLAQAFQNLTRPLLSRTEEDLRPWRDALRDALDLNGQLMVALVPELKAIIGEQPPVSELPPQDAQRRFHSVFRRFLSVFARPE